MRVLVGSRLYSGSLYRGCNINYYWKKRKYVSGKVAPNLHFTGVSALPPKHQRICIRESNKPLRAATPRTLYRPLPSMLKTGRAPRRFKTEKPTFR